MKTRIFFMVLKSNTKTRHVYELVRFGLFENIRNEFFDWTVENKNEISKEQNDKFIILEMKII